MATTPYSWDMSSDPSVTNRPSWLPSIDEYRTPREDWDRFTSTQQPFWSTRAPMADVGQNLRSRYLLGAPAMAQQGLPPTFNRFLQDWPGAEGGVDPAALRARAWQAANASMEPVGPYLSGATPGTPGWNQRAWLSSQFGEGAEQAASNQLGVAQMLALQRSQDTGGGVYRGQMANAIRNAMSNMYQGRINVGAPKESFLDWYLGQTGSRPTTSIRA